MAVDLPVPVVPMSLKCLASSWNGIGIPASVNRCGSDLPSRRPRRCETIAS